MTTDVSLLGWGAFVAGVTCLLVVDLRLMRTRAHAIGVRDASVQSAAWVAIGLVFGVVLLAWQGGTAGGQYFAAYLVELSLSVDNVFVWALILAHFAVPPAYQYRVLFWGILGAVVLRGAFIFAGVAVLERADWVIYVFGAFLLVTALRLVIRDDSGINPNRHPLGRFVHRWRPTMEELSGPYFVVRQDGRLRATPLLAVLLLVGTTDVVFAVDSIPAVLGVTQDRFVAFTSNVLAVLGLRALYFLLAALQARFAYLQQGMAVILGFVGVKMLVSGVVVIPTWVALTVIALALTVSIASSLRVRPAEEVWPLRSR
jgi:tellurite resistance protein TerC